MAPSSTPNPKNCKTTTSNTDLNPPHTPRMTPRFHGLDKIKPFLRQVEKIVTEETMKHDKAYTFPWYKTWDSWSTKKLLDTKTWNQLSNIIFPNLKYNNHTIKSVVNTCLAKIPPIKSYIEITSLTDKLVNWTSCVGDIESFISVTYKRSRKNTSDIPQLPARKMDPERKFHSLRSNLNQSFTSSIATSPSKDNNVATLPTTIHIDKPDNEVSPAKQEISAITLIAIAEINQAVNTAKPNVIDSLKEDYTSMLSTLDKTKVELDAETKLTVEGIQNVLDNSSQASKYVSHANTKLEETKLEIEETKEAIEQLDLNVENIATKARTATNEAISTYANELYDTNQDHIADMEDIFSENMGLMQDLQQKFNPQHTINEVTSAIISRMEETTTAFTASAITQLHDGSNTIINEFSSKLNKDSIFLATRDNLTNEMTTTNDNGIKVITDATTLANATSTSCITSIREIKDNASLDIINSIQNTKKGCHSRFQI